MGYLGLVVSKVHASSGENPFNPKQTDGRTDERTDARTDIWMPDVGLFDELC